MVVVVCVCVGGGGGRTCGQGKHNKYCHFCQHVKLRASAMMACETKGCARRYCEHCLTTQLKDDLCKESSSSWVNGLWTCPVCRKVCCCASQSECTRNHRHCKAYRYRRRRAEQAAKKQVFILSLSLYVYLYVSLPLCLSPSMSLSTFSCPVAEHFYRSYTSPPLPAGASSSDAHVCCQALQPMHAVPTGSSGMIPQMVMAMTGDYKGFGYAHPHDVAFKQHPMHGYPGARAEKCVCVCLCVCVM